MLYEWARSKSGLETPKKKLAEKKGKGIYHRYFYYIPSKGTGAVDRSRLPALNAVGTSKLHEFIDIGTPGKLSRRRRRGASSASRPTRTSRLSHGCWDS